MTNKEFNAPFIQLAKYFRISAKEQKEMTNKLRLVSKYAGVTTIEQEQDLKDICESAEKLGNISPKKA